MHFLKIEPAPYNPTSISMRCPSCRQNGSFVPIPQVQDIGWHNPAQSGDAQGQHRAGIRRCPNEACRALVFIVSVLGEPDVCYPPEVIDFDANNLPKDILTTLEEAIKCHSVGCYRAAALMVRRTLEELCDEKNATGKNLKDRIESLKSIVVIPGELLTAADELRILGNDAAHVELKDFDKVGKEESELAIELAKELLKAIYQYAALLGRLQSLKSTAKSSP